MSHMTEHYSHGTIHWVNLKNPTQEDIQAVASEYEIPLIFLSDLLTPVPKNYAVYADGFVKIAMDFPVIKQTNKANHYEVKFFITKKGLITIQYEEMEAMDRFKREFEVAATLNKHAKNATGVHIFFALLGELYTSCTSKLDYVESILSEIESEIFKENERQMVFSIAQSSKKIIAFRHTLLTHSGVYEDARPLFEAHFKKSFEYDFENIDKTYTNLMHRTNALFDTLDALRETNFAMLTAKQNEIMKTLTIMAFITFPLTLFTSMFGMNTMTTPIVGKQGDFWIIVSVMLTATIFFFIFFKYKKWM